jgi:hypothetical protein
MPYIWYLDDFWKIPIDTSAELATIQSAASSRAETAQVLSEPAELTDQIAFSSTEYVRSESAQNTPQSSQSVVQISSVSNIQIRTVKPSKSKTASMAEKTFNSYSLFQTKQFSMIALGCTLMVLTCCLWVFYRRWRQRRISKSYKFTNSNSTINPHLSNNDATNQTPSSQYSTTSDSTSMSFTSSTQYSAYSQDQTMSITLVSTELGNFLSICVCESLVYYN